MTLSRAVKVIDFDKWMDTIFDLYNNNNVYIIGMPSFFREKAGEKNQRGDQRIIFRNFQQKTKGGSIIYEK